MVFGRLGNISDIPGIHMLDLGVMESSFKWLYRVSFYISMFRTYITYRTYRIKHMEIAIAFRSEKYGSHSFHEIMLGTISCKIKVHPKSSR